ncbi:Rne/Rng family ribonuclease [Rhodoplanes sp. SY1]|uniref:Rne/Rng family ribonuclease n=1 Tax=Rhodoplanes sp. SY1 TaxID=3166646 RepID=UPI0038B4E1E0
MANKMLIDATHPEETRVVVLRGNRVEEFDFESASRRQLRGNIYLAKVTRVEPSLQAAFVDYGGNRHGFLAFSEIHPDYYQIPVADRQMLIDEEERAHRAAEAEADRRAAARSGARQIPAERPPHRDDRVASEPVPAAPASDAAVSEARESQAPTADAAGFGAPSADASATDASATDAFATDASAEAMPAGAGPVETPHIPSPGEAQTELAFARSESDIPPAAPALTEPTTAVAEAAAAAPAGDADATPPTEPVPPPVVAEGEAVASEPAAPAEPTPVAALDGEVLPPAPSADSATPGNGHDVEDDDEDDDEEDDDEDEEEDDDDEEEEEEVVESVGGADALEELPDRTPRYRRQYKIQEVIKRRQVMLVQVVKEERGTKGAALTTYLSLAGRYSVLMPNTARGGGISRKITNTQDRKRLKEIAQDLEVPEGMGVILRTAGAARTKTEVKRDFEYLLRVWEQVRDLTLKSSAPTLVYEEGSVVKRAIRDLYNKEIDEVIVAGEDAYREAKDFMRMLMPSHAKNVKLYAEPQPLLTRYGVETQLDAMFSPTVQLRSGGYIVLNQTEALVAIDVNSGRATREHHIEDTALKTNLEACEEVARQLRLRDLAGLIVIDFIDMDEKRNNRSVERKLKECLKNDRARIQVGRISHFGLMEMSRQRIRTSVFESSTEKCPHCGGTGHVRSVSSVALQCLRMLEETLMRGATHNLTIRTGTDTALYILNHKRAHLAELEQRFRLVLTVRADESVMGAHPFVIEKNEQVHSLEQARAIAAQSAAALPAPSRIEEDDEDEIEAEAYEAEVDEDEVEETEARTDTENGDGEGDGRGRRRRRRRRGRRGDEREERGERGPMVARAPAGEAEAGETEGDDEADGDDAEGEGQAARNDGEGENGDGGRRRRRRGRRGGRRNRRQDGAPGPLGGPEPGFDLVEPELAHAIEDFGGPRLGEEIPSGEQPELPVSADAAPRAAVGDEAPVTSTPADAPVERGSSFAPVTATASGFDEIGPENLPEPEAGFDAPLRPEPRRGRGRSRHVDAPPPPPDFGPVEPPEPLQALAPESVTQAPVAPAAARAPAAEPAPAEPPRRRSTVREPVSFVLGGNGTSSANGDATPRPVEPAPAPSEPAPAPETSAVAQSSPEAESGKPRRTGWWARKLLGDKG